MRYIAFATDYDGTIASGGRVDEATLGALEKLKASGRKLFLVTGRHLGDLQNVFPDAVLFDRIVAENGAVIYDPAKREEKTLAEAPKAEFVAALHAERIPFDVGRSIISSHIPYEKPILDVIRRLALEYQVIFNKGAVMVLPSGVNKATGLRAALEELRLSFHNAVGIGDGENDHAFLTASECGVAVANAVPALRERADIVTAADHSEGAAELISHLLRDDLQDHDEQLARSSLVLGERSDEAGAKISIVPNRSGILVAGASSSGKSSAVAGLLEQFEERGYHFCLIDPEGDYENFAGALSVGSPTEPPDPNVVMRALESERSVIVNLMGVAVRERPGAFAALLPKILEMRARTARPHWLIIDEAHHLAPTSWTPASTTMPQEMGGTILVTVDPERLSGAALALVDVVFATGEAAREVLAAFAKAAHAAFPYAVPPAPQGGQALVWFPRRQGPPVIVTAPVAKSERRRHRRNYAEGELSLEQSFYFRGPESKLNLRAQNLMTFLQLAEGVDEETWLFHLKQGDYSRWFETVVKDQELADCARSIERDNHQTAAETHARIKEEIEKRYTAPA